MTLLLPRTRNAWDPLTGISQLQSEMNRLFSSLGDGWENTHRNGHKVWAIPMDIWEDQDHVMLKADLPGVDSKDIDVSVTGDMLSISVQRIQDTIPEEQINLRERTHGWLHRKIQLPQAVDVDKLKATYKQGVLELKLPKREEAKPKQIQIEVK